jgi:integrase
MVAKLKPGEKRLTLPDPELRGHYIRITTKGAKSFVAVARDPDGKQVWATIGGCDVLTIAEARDKAREAIQRIKSGQPAFEAVTALLDMVEDESGPRQADTVLATLSSIMHWHAARTDDYVPPIVRGRSRYDPHAKKRARILDDDEIRALWAAADKGGPFGAFLKLLLLTGQRRQKVAAMRWQDLTLDGTWDIPTEAREKGNGGTLLLPEVAQEIIRSQKRIGSNAYVFAGRGDGHFSGYGLLKSGIDREAGIAPWVLHDLRRTSRSLMARAGVRSEIAERVLGHVLPGVEGIYDRHSYAEEKADALAKLAGLVALILDPPDENVVSLHG